MDPSDSSPNSVSVWWNDRCGRLDVTFRKFGKKSGNITRLFGYWLILEVRNSSTTLIHTRSRVNSPRSVVATLAPRNADVARQEALAVLTQ